jgi:DNA-binding NtrC family response regulator
MVIDEPSQRLLITWSDRGLDGPAPAHHVARAASDRGPVLRLLEHTEPRQRYQRAIVLTVPRGRAKAQALASDMAQHVPAIEVREVALDDPSDYNALFAELGPLATELGRQVQRAAWEIDVLLSAGTPQAQTLWVILVQAAMLPARMLQVIPAAFVPSPHPHPIRAVRLEVEGFPEIRVLREEVVRLRAEASAKRPAIIAASEPMRAMMARVPRVATSDLPVLILGETGVGKELIARAIHQGSERSHGPFVAENCSALAESVLASELFGHEAAAFTGAGKAHRGLFEQASGGTVFLDEVGEMSAQVQAMLLRVLQERVLRRVGGERSISVDVRVIAATHRDLSRMVAQGQFREDLYYRLRGITLQVPPLRQRVADLPSMIQAFQQEILHRGRPLPVSAAAMRALAAYAWPGNVRQLRSEVHRWAVFCDHVVEVQDLSPEIQEAISPPRSASPPATPTPGVSPPVPSLTTLADAVRRTEMNVIQQTLTHFDGNLVRTAASLEIQRNTLKRKLRELDLYPTSAPR